jgi:predicted nuclease with TOPRIM domain
MPKTETERIQQLENAHSRLHNSFQTLQQDMVSIRKELQDAINQLKEQIKLIPTAAPAEPEELPEDLLNNREYKGVIQSVIKSTPATWKNMQYVNHEVKLVGKEEYAYLAFIPAAEELKAGDKVRFTYVHPFQLRKLKVR